MKKFATKLWRSRLSFTVMPAHICANGLRAEQLVKFLLSNAEAAEDAVEHVVGVNGADHFAELG